MLCLTLSAPNEQLGTSGGNAFIGRSDMQIAYASLAQPTGCAVNQYVLLQASEVPSSPFNLSVDDGGAVSAAILGVWAIGFGIRCVIRTLRDTSDGSEASE